MINKIIFTILFLLGPLYANADCKSNNVPLENLSDYSYVLVPGIFNEFIAFYMTEYRNYLLDNGVPRNQIKRFNSSTFVYPHDESVRLGEAINDFSKDKPIVFLGHSKGALETLYMLKDFDLSRVHHAYFIQGPFDGVSSHEIFYSPIHADEAYAMKVVKKLAKWAFVSDRYYNFSKQEVRERVRASLQKPGILEKLTFIISETDYDKLPTKLKLIGGLYKDHYDELGDGVLLKENQLPKDLDVNRTCVLDIPGSHDLFVKAAPWESERVERIHSFIEFLFTNPVSGETF